MTKLTSLLLALPLFACASTPDAPVDTSEVHSLSGLAAKDMKGQEHDLGALRAKGEPIAIVFWQTWCASCVAEAPSLGLAATEHPGIHFVGVLSGPDELVNEFEVLEAQRKYGLGYPQLRDRDLSITDYFDVKGTPTIIVIDGGGHVVFRGHEAPEDWSAFEGSAQG